MHATSKYKHFFIEQFCSNFVCNNFYIYNSATDASTEKFLNSHPGFKTGVIIHPSLLKDFYNANMIFYNLSSAWRMQFYENNIEKQNLLKIVTHSVGTQPKTALSYLYPGLLLQNELIRVDKKSVNLSNIIVNNPKAVEAAFYNFMCSLIDSLRCYNPETNRCEVLADGKTILKLYKEKNFSFREKGLNESLSILAELFENYGKLTCGSNFNINSDD